MAKISDIENVLRFEKIAYKRILTQLYFCQFRKKEFFNISHRRLHNFALFIRLKWGILSEIGFIANRY
jgi:hypothetical protein